MIQKFAGSEIEKILKPLAELRILIFKDFPYLYEGSFEYEKKYLSRYLKSEKSAVIAYFDQDQIVGAATVLPLASEDSAIQKPFIDHQVDLENHYYFGESLLRKEYRGQGIGHLFFDEREKHALQDSKCQWTTFCAVDRPQNHPLRPPQYQPLDLFWQKRGYTKQHHLKTQLSWQDLNEKIETPKTLTFWTKPHGKN